MGYIVEIPKLSITKKEVRAPCEIREIKIQKENNGGTEAAI